MTSICSHAAARQVRSEPKEAASAPRPFAGSVRRRVWPSSHRDLATRASCARAAAVDDRSPCPRIGRAPCKAARRHRLTGPWRRDRQAADERGCRKNRRPCKASDLTWPPARMSGCRRELLRTPGRRFLAPLRFRSRDPGHLWASFLQDGDPGSHETLAGLARDGVHMRSDTRSVSSPRARRVNVVLFGQRKAPRRAVVMSAPLWLRSRRVLLCSPR